MNAMFCALFIHCVMILDCSAMICAGRLIRPMPPSFLGCCSLLTETFAI